MNIISRQSPEEMLPFIRNHKHHYAILRSYSDEASSDLELELTPQEMTKLVEFISNLKEKDYKLK